METEDRGEIFTDLSLIHLQQLQTQKPAGQIQKAEISSSLPHR